MAPKCKVVGKNHFRLQDETNTQPRIMIANHAGRTSKEKVRLARELGNVADCQNIQDTSNNPINEASNQQQIDDVQVTHMFKGWFKTKILLWTKNMMKVTYIKNVKLVAQWNSEKSKRRSEKNKVARNQKIMNQTTGRRSFAQVQQKLRKEKGRPPSRVELFHACFTHANGRPSNSIVAKKLDAMKELANKLPEDLDDQVGHDDIFAQIIGPDRPGRVRMFGDGVSPSDLWGDVPSRSTCNRIVMEQKTKLEKMDEQVRKQGEHIAMLEAKISNQPNQNLGSNYTPSSSNSSLSVPARLSLRIGCSVSIKSLFDSMKIVAKGVVRSMDPNAEVGRQMLGPNWCEIQVLVILEPEESLIRPYDFLQKIGDALGGMIAWPCHLLTVNQDFY